MKKPVKKKVSFKKNSFILILNYVFDFSVPELDEFVRCQTLCQLFVHGFDGWTDFFPNL